MMATPPAPRRAPRATQLGIRYLGIMTTLESRIQAALRDVRDFPSVGILFKDITPVLADPTLMHDIIEAMAEMARGAGATRIVGVESRGFLFGMPLALAMQLPFAPARKPGKLPWRTERVSYDLEYRSDVLEMHVDAVGAGDRVLIVDDVLATGGTAAATSALVERLGASVVGISVLVELRALGARALLADRSVQSLVSF
jgi:adenine phosphoribosyltransferase